MPKGARELKIQVTRPVQSALCLVLVMAILSLGARSSELSEMELDLTRLDRVERCTTCHAGSEDPDLTDNAQPMAAHPGDLLQHHPIGEFGCVVCHGGIGESTTLDAHGTGSEALLPAGRIEQSCIKCHADEALEGAEKYNEGMAVFKAQPCLFCHQLHGEGATVGPSLNGTGKRHEKDWHVRHFNDPRSVVPTSTMPGFGLSDEEVDALTWLMMGLTDDGVPGGLKPGSYSGMASGPEDGDRPRQGAGTEGHASPLLKPINIQQGCLTAGCHTQIVAGEFIHGPTRQQQCTVCHTLTNEVGHQFELAAQPPDLCFNCHGRPEKVKYIHGPVAQGACTACHSPHSSPNRFMLAESGNKQCFICHTQMAEHVSQASVQHGAVEQFGCVQCHDPHRGEEKFRLRSPLPTLCLQCHPQIREIIEHATTPHQALVIEKKCVNCHDPHGSDEPKILADKQINLCLGCHDEPMETANGMIIDMKSWIESNPVRHGPINEGNCAACHKPHGSPNFRMLMEPFPNKFYSSFDLENYGLCFSCHEQTLVLDQETSTLTGFRNGEVNLHFLHVNQKKGRTCRACHEIHAGTKPKRIKDNVTFGNWVFPLNYTKNDDGGSCLPGCHVKRTYNRIKPIVQD